jgi:hypothetical protein
MPLVGALLVLAKRQYLTKRLSALSLRAPFSPSMVHLSLDRLPGEELSMAGLQTHHLLTGRTALTSMDLVSITHIIFSLCYLVHHIAVGPKRRVRETEHFSAPLRPMGETGDYRSYLIIVRYALFLGAVVMIGPMPGGQGGTTGLLLLTGIKIACAFIIMAI